MKKIIASLLVLFSISATATPVLITDGYTGSNSHGHGDVIGDASKFGISSMTVDLVGSTLSVLISTPFADNGLGTFTGYTASGNGIGFGDLFLSSSGWNPYGTSPYLSDDHSNGTVWDYGVSLGDRWDKSSSASVWSLSGSNDDNAMLAEDFMTGAIYRNGQEIAVDTASQTTSMLLLNSASFDATTAGQILITLDISGTALATASSIGLHWGMTCGNDTIEGEYAVPEPTTLLLMMLGFVGLTIVGMRRKQTASLDR